MITRPALALASLTAACGGPTLVEQVGWELHPEIGSLVTVSWQQLEPATVSVEYSVDAGSWLRSPARDLQPGSQEQLLLGVPYDTEFSLRLVSEVEGREHTSEEHMASTGPLSEPLLEAELLVGEPELWEPTGEYLYTSIFWQDKPFYGACWRLILDRQGRVVWMMENESDSQTFYASVSRDGDDLLWDDTRLFYPSESTVRRIKIDGSEVHVYPTQASVHAFTELDDESIVWGSYADGFFETLRQVDVEGQEQVLWDCEAFEAEWGSPNQYCVSNALYWHRETDSFLYSFFSSMTVLQLDRPTSTVLHSWGQLSDWSFDPPESQFDWQHGVSFTAAGNLLLSTHASTESDEGVVREFELDQENKVLRQVWSFAEGDGIDAHEYGEAHRLPGGNTLHNYGSTTRLREATPEGRVVWDLAWLDDDGEPLPAFIGRSVFVEDLYTFLP